MQNVLARAAILVRGRLILAEDLRLSPSSTPAAPAELSHEHPLSLKDLLAETERGQSSTPWSRQVGIGRKRPVCWESAAANSSTKSSSTACNSKELSRWAEIPRPSGESRPTNNLFCGARIPTLSEYWCQPLSAPSLQNCFISFSLCLLRCVGWTRLAFLEPHVARDHRCFPKAAFPLRNSPLSQGLRMRPGEAANPVHSGF